ncbi:hypothetical protein BDZ89DRAFT_1115006 [Hymenopellis radicata]|nr:hypothetical protein BDZ89DRAFT_1115006 [Hymenopellis radicata]
MPRISPCRCGRSNSDCHWQITNGDRVCHIATPANYNPPLPAFQRDPCTGIGEQQRGTYRTAITEGASHSKTIAIRKTFDNPFIRQDMDLQEMEHRVWRFLRREAWIQQASLPSTWEAAVLATIHNRYVGVQCLGCAGIVSSEMYTSLLALWLRHRDSCRGIEHKIVCSVMAAWERGESL